MGSLLGNYVHLRFEDYVKYGTYRDTSKWDGLTTKEGKEYKAEDYAKKDFDPNIFKKYMKAIRTESSSKLLQFSQLKKYETDYNNRRKSAFNSIANMLKVGNIPENFFRSVVNNANLGKSIDADSLVRFIVTNEKTESIDINDTLKKILIDSKVQAIPPFTGEKYTLQSTINRRMYGTNEGVSYNGGTAKIIMDLIGKLKKDFPDISARIEKEWKALDTAWQNFVNDTDQIEGLAKAIGLEENETSPYALSVPIKISNAIVNKLNALTFACVNSDNIRRILASFAEMMGELILESHSIEHLAWEEVLNVVNYTASGFNNTLTNFDSQLMVSLDQKALKEYVKNHPNQAIVRKGSKDNYYIEINYSTQQKADFLLQYDDSDFEKLAGMNMKNTDMSKTSYFDKVKNRPMPANIQIHGGTSLLVFLMAVQQENLIANIHNHFLNVFSASPIAHQALRKDAADAILLSLLYSSLSGRGLGKTEGFADILAIEDKNTKLQNGFPRVRFYSISSIITDISKRISEGVNPIKLLDFTPNFYTFRLHNIYQKSGVKMRITKLLLDARSKKIYMGISKMYLNNIYK